ncbi:MAG: hypothetical protein ABFS34_05715 [Gemmatimonadota bacterium]
MTEQRSTGGYTRSRLIAMVGPVLLAACVPAEERPEPTHAVIADSMVWCPTHADFREAKDGLMEDALLARLECGFFAEGDSVKLIRSDGPDALVTMIPADGSEPTVDDNVWTSVSGLR